MMTQIKKKITQIWVSIPIIIFLLSVSCLTFALTHTSSNYTLKNARIVVSGGQANSFNYSLNDVNIGKITAGKAESLNYTLDATNVAKTISQTPPNPPALNPVTTPTNVSTQTLSGTKDRGASIYINGYEVVPFDDETSWSASLIGLVEGSNHSIITARNRIGLESEAVFVSIILDTEPPDIIITSPKDRGLVTTNPVVVEGTIDEEPFSTTKGLVQGPNPVSIEVSDEAGNFASRSIEIYLVREPLALPQQ